MSCKKCKRLTFITDYESWLDFYDGTIMCPTCYEPMGEICSLMTDGNLGLFDEEMDITVKVLKKLTDEELKTYKANVELIIEKHESFGLYKHDEQAKFADEKLAFEFYHSILDYKPEDDTYEEPNNPLRLIANKYAKLIEADLEAHKAYTDEDTLASLKTSLFNLLNDIYGAE